VPILAKFLTMKIGVPLLSRCKKILTLTRLAKPSRKSASRLSDLFVPTEPNELVAQIHDRLALILHPRDYDRWLGIDDKGATCPLRSTFSFPTPRTSWL
jgi:hypothetical protein